MKFAKSFVVVASALVLAACDSSDGNDSIFSDGPTTSTATFQVVHASPDAPAVNVLLNGSAIANGADFGQTTAERTVVAGSNNVQVDAVLADGTTPAVVGPADLDFAADTITQIVALGPVAVPLDFAVVSKPDMMADAGNVRLTVLHATPGIGVPVDVYVTAPGADLTATAPTGTFDFKETLGPVEVPAGDYQVRVTPTGAPTTVAFDSGTVSLTEGLDLTAVAVPNTDGGSALVNLLAVSATGAFDIFDVNTPTGLRIGHLSPDTDPVDVLVNGAIFLNDVPYPAITGIFSLPADTYTVSITDGANPGVVLLPDTELMLEAGTVYTALATGFNANLAVDILSADDPRSVALYSKVRIIHAAPNPAAESVDIYVVDPALMGDLSEQTPAFAGVPFGANTGYTPLDPGTYDVFVTIADTTTVAISAQIQIEAGGVYTAIARDPIPGEQDFAIEVLVDELNEET